MDQENQSSSTVNIREGASLPVFQEDAHKEAVHAMLDDMFVGSQFPLKIAGDLDSLKCALKTVSHSIGEVCSVLLKRFLVFDGVKETLWFYGSFFFFFIHLYFVSTHLQLLTLSLSLSPPSPPSLYLYLSPLFHPFLPTARCFHSFSHGKRRERFRWGAPKCSRKGAQ